MQAPVCTHPCIPLQAWVAPTEHNNVGARAHPEPDDAAPPWQSEQSTTSSGASTLWTPPRSLQLGRNQKARNQDWEDKSTNVGAQGHGDMLALQAKPGMRRSLSSDDVGSGLAQGALLELPAAENATNAGDEGQGVAVEAGGLRSPRVRSLDGGSMAYPEQQPASGTLSRAANPGLQHPISRRTGRGLLHWESRPSRLSLQVSRMGCQPFGGLAVGST